MWYVNSTFDAARVESLNSEGFQLQSSGGVMRIEKDGCGAELRKTPGGEYQMTELPSILLRGEFTQLWDAGYQKFLLTRDGAKSPATARQLGALRLFNEELRTVLGIPTYYNEALGSVSAISVYDRVKGRPGAVPDESVGAKPPVGH